MDPVTAIGLVSNLIGFIETGTKLCVLIKEYSSASGAPEEVIAASKRLELVITMIKELDSSGKSRLDHEKLALKICSDEAEELRVLLEGLRIPSGEEKDGGWFLKRFSSGKKSIEKGWKAFKTLRGREKIEKFQNSLQGILALIQMQQQSRMEGTTLSVDHKAGILVENSRSILNGLSELRLISKQPEADTLAVQYKTIFIVPLVPNPYFRGRENILERLELELKPLQEVATQKANLSRKCALYGLGGIGKTQIALQFALMRRGRMPHASIFWVHASTSTRFVEDFKRLAAEFQLPGRDDPQVDILQIVQNWLENHYQRPWLMVIDNVDDLQIFMTLQTGKSLFEYIPKTAKGSVLFTSRNKDICFDLVEDPINVPPMSIEEARLLLLRSRIDGASSREQEQDTLLQELDYLPLAIMQAVSYMIKRRMTIPQYLELFRHSEASRLTLLEQKFVSLGRQATSFDSVATTWIVTFHQVRVENPSAAELLCMLSLLDREDIPYTLISGGYSDPAAFNVAMGLLESYSFVSTNEAGDNYSMHRLVQSASRAWLMDQEALFKQLSSRVVQAVSTQFPNCEFENWSTCARYLPHAESILSHRLESGTEVDRRARAKLLANVSWYVKCQGNYSLARQRAEESLEIYRVTGQSDCVEALQVKCKLASILVQQGHLEDAIKLYRKTLEEQENLLGVDHHDTSDTVDQLALALANTLPPENWKMAEVLANKALANRQLSLPDNHPKILASLRTLGWILYKQGRYMESEEFLRTCMLKREAALGNHHPETSEIANELALVLLRLSPPNFEEAEHLLRQSASIASLLCGTEHPSTIITYSNLSDLLRRLEKYQEAEVLQRNQLRLSNKILGKNHPTTLWCVASLASVLFQEEKYFQANDLLRNELRERQELVDNDVLAALDLVDLRGRVCERAGGFEEAKRCFEKSVEGRSKQLGLNDPRTLQSRHGLASVLRNQGKYREAETILLQVISKYEAILGENHEETLASTTLLGITYYRAKRYSEAEDLFRRVLAGKEETLGCAHASTLATRDNLEASLWKEEKWEEWEPYCRRSLEMRTRVSPDDYDTLRVTSNLWFVLEKLGSDESGKVFERLLNKIKAMPPKLLETKSFQKKMSNDEAWYFKQFCGV